MKTKKIIKIFMAMALLISFETSVIATSTGVVNTDTVRVREKADTKSEIVELVSIGDKITILGEEGNWYKVKVGKVTGYIRKDLLNVDGKVTEETPNQTTNNNQASENVNNNSTTNNGEKTTENNSNTTTTTNQSEKTNTNSENNAETGNSSEKNTNTLKDDDKTISIIKIGELSSGEKIKLTSDTKIKILPSANSSNIEEVKANTEVTVVEIINSWCKIETSEGACGWVRIDQ